MTRKDYRLIADVIHDLADNDRIDPRCASLLRRTFAEELEDHNPRFDRERFMKAATPVAAADRVH